MKARTDTVLLQPVRNYADAERLLLSRVRDDPRPYSERGAIAGRAVRALLERLGRPQDRLRFLHIAGSKGKGSVALLCEHLLLSEREPTGTFTSPHLSRWNERIRIDGAPVSDAHLCAVLEDLRPHLGALDALSEEDAPSFFDVLTAAALESFLRAGCRTVVLEVGLGGLYDATNVISPIACCITSIELEHTDKLGTTLASVAWHKAGIIKAGVPVVTGPLPAEAGVVVQAQAREMGARELRYAREWEVTSHPAELANRRVHYREATADGEYVADFACPHPAPHMAVNACLALALTRAAGFAPDPTCLTHCPLPARAQVLSTRPWIMVDGAHTPASLLALGECLDAIPAARRRFLVAATRGKSVAALASLLSGAEHVVVTCADPMRSAPAPEVAEALRAGLPGTIVTAVDDPRRALATARADLTDDAVLCVCGSVYLAGLALAELEGPGKGEDESV